jgi:AcrR family transcriptional regulator
MGRKPRKGTFAEDGLTEHAIVDVARQIIAESGAAALTMRRLSDGLGVALGATYHHVPHRKALMTLVAQDIYRDLDLPDIGTGEWTDHLHVAITNFARLVYAHPGMAAEIAQDHVALVPIRLGAFISERLGSAGFTTERTELVMATLFFYVGGLALVVPTPEPSQPAGISLSALTYFESGLRIVISGIAAELGGS